MSTTNPEERAKRLPPDSRRLYESFRDAGMGPGAALAATAGRDGQIPSVDPNEEGLEAFRQSGLSEAGARAAMRGRGLGDSMFVEDAATPALKDPGQDNVQRKAAKARKKREAEKKGKAKVAPRESATDLHKEMELRELTESLTREELSAIRQSDFFWQRSQELMESGCPHGSAMEQAEKDIVAKVKQIMDNS